MLMKLLKLILSLFVDFGPSPTPSPNPVVPVVPTPPTGDPLRDAINSFFDAALLYCTFALGDRAIMKVQGYVLDKYDVFKKGFDAAITNSPEWLYTAVDAGLKAVSLAFANNPLVYRSITIFRAVLQAEWDKIHPKVQAMFSAIKPSQPQPPAPVVAA